MATDAASLLDDVKNYLDITWLDVGTDSKLLGIIGRGIAYLDRIAGEELDYSIEDKPKELLLDYCRYARSNALNEFSINYLTEINSLQISKGVERYGTTSTE